MQKAVRQPQKEPAEREKIQHRAEKNAEQHKRPQLPSADIERQKQQAEQKIEGKQKIEPDSQRAAPPADKAEDIVKHAEQCAGQDADA